MNSNVYTNDVENVNSNEYNDEFHTPPNKYRSIQSHIDHECCLNANMCLYCIKIKMSNLIPQKIKHLKAKKNKSF
jgi:hypothetical protein